MFCTKCGNQMEGGSKFCGKCGNAMTAQPMAPAQPVMPEQPAAPVQPGAVVQPNIGYAQPNGAYVQPAMQPHAAAMGPRKKLWPFIVIGGVIIAAVVAVILIVTLTGSSNSLVGTWRPMNMEWDDDFSFEIRFNRDGTGANIERWRCCCTNWRWEEEEWIFDWNVSGDRLTIDDRWDTETFFFEVTNGGRRLEILDNRRNVERRFERVR